MLEKRTNRRSVFLDGPFKGVLVLTADAGLLLVLPALTPARADALDLWIRSRAHRIHKRSKKGHPSPVRPLFRLALSLPNEVGAIDFIGLGRSRFDSGEPPLTAVVPPVLFWWGDHSCALGGDAGCCCCVVCFFERKCVWCVEGGVFALIGGERGRGFEMSFGGHLIFLNMRSESGCVETMSCWGLQKNGHS